MLIQTSMIFFSYMFWRMSKLLFLYNVRQKNTIQQLKVVFFTDNHSLYGFGATWGWLYLILGGNYLFKLSLCNDLTVLKVISVLFFHMHVPLHRFSLRNMSQWKKADRFLEGNVPPGLITRFKEFDTCVVHTFDGSSPLRLSLWPSGKIGLKTQAFSLYPQTKLCLFSFLQSSGAFSLRSGLWSCISGSICCWQK